MTTNPTGRNMYTPMQDPPTIQYYKESIDVYLASHDIARIDILLLIIL